MRTRFIATALVLISFFGSAANARPNVLFLFADDQRADTIGAWGNHNIRTPNLDRLAADGFSFRRNYCFGSNSGAVCVPSRAMLMSGRTWLGINNQLKDVRTWPEELRDSGYRTFMTGKWHNGPQSVVRVFPQAKSVFLGGMDDHTKVPVQDIEDGRLVNKRTGAKFSSELFADEAIGFLRGHKGEEPFLAYVAFTAPHDPRMPPEKYARAYYERRPPLPPNFLPQHPFDHGQLVGRDEELAAWPRTREVVSDQLAEYYGMITHLDEQVGRILAALEETGLAKDTLVVYAADHGLAIGSHGLLGKQSVYEHSMRCPLIVRGPGVPAGKETTAMTYLLDLGPTILDVVGAEPMEGVEGTSLRGVWEGKAERVRDSVFLPYQDLMRAVSDGRWKMIRYPKIDHTQLFDMANDPDEMKDLAAEPERRGEIERLTKLLHAWRERVGDRAPLTVATPRAKAIDLTGRERKADQWQPDWIRKKYFEPQE